MRVKLQNLLSVMAGVAVTLILSTVQADANTKKVDCDEDQSIQEKLDIAKNGDTIEVSGYCSEQIRITTNNLRLVGVGGATIDGGADASEGNSVVVVHALNVAIAGLTITGGRSGIVVSRNGSAIIGENSPGSGNTIDSVGRHGITVTDGGWAQIDNNVIKDAGRHGIIVSGGAADLTNNDVRRSVRDGLFVSTSRVDLEGVNTFLENARRGIFCNQLGALRVTASQTLVDLVTPANNNTGGDFLNSGASCSVSNTVAFP